MEEEKRTAEALVERREELARAVYRALLRESSAESGRPPREEAARLRDIGLHLEHLAEALRYAAPGLYSAYLRWLGELFRGLGLEEGYLEQQLRALSAGLRESLPLGLAEPALSLIESLRGGTELRLPADETEGQLHREAAAYLSLLLEGDRGGAAELVDRLLDEGLSIRGLFLDIFQASQVELGRLWLAGRVSVAAEHYCTAATQVNIARLYPRLFSTPSRGPKVVAACVGGELHELGIRMVADILELEGWSTFYLGADTPRAGILTLLREREPRLLCLSATLSGNLPELEALIAELRPALGAKAPAVMVGGGPFNRVPGLWERLGADGYARDAGKVADAARALVG